MRKLYFFFLEGTYLEEWKTCSQYVDIGYTLKIFHRHLAFHRSRGQCNWMSTLLVLRFEERKHIIYFWNILYILNTINIGTFLGLDSVQTMIYIGLFIVEEAKTDWGELRCIGHIPKRIAEGRVKTMRRCWRRSNWKWAHFETMMVLNSSLLREVLK